MTSRLISILAVPLVLLAVYGGFSYTTSANKIATQAAELATLSRSYALLQSRVNSYQTLLARRDAAIEASKCKATIQSWIKDPSKLPKKVDQTTIVPEFAR